MKILFVLAVLLAFAAPIFVTARYHESHPSAPISHKLDNSVSTSSVSAPLTAPNSASSALQEMDQNTDRNLGELDISVDSNATLLITDPSGQSTGRVPRTNEELQQIPNSAYFEDRIDNDATGQPGQDVNHYEQITRPVEGRYVLTLTGVVDGTYTVSVSAYSQDGTAQPVLSHTGTIKTGAHAQFVILFRSNAGQRNSTLSAL